MENICSVEALVSNNGKNYKGILDFYEDKCILYNNSNIIDEFFYDISSAEFVEGTTIVNFLDIYTKEKAYIQVKCDGRVSQYYIIEDDKLNLLITTLNRHKNNSKGYSEESVKPNIKEIIKIDDYNENILDYFLSNPYSILGIPSNSSNDVAYEAFEKIKKLDRLKVIDSYNPEYYLGGYEPKEKTLAICQNALSSIKEIKYKWFWFNSKESCLFWQSEYIRRKITKNGNVVATYDEFLAHYLYLLSFDVEFNQRNKWYDIFAFYQYVVGEKHVEVLLTKLNNEEKNRINKEDLLVSFENNIFLPIDEILEVADIEAMLRFYRSLRMDRYNALKDFKRSLGGRITQWFIEQEKELWSQIEIYIDENELTEKQSNLVWLAAQKYDNKVQIILKDALSALQKEPLRVDMIIESYNKVMQQIMILLIHGNNKIEACKYAQYLYKYSNEDVKEKLAGIFGEELFYDS